jgi:hypothetical protein
MTRTSGPGNLRCTESHRWRWAVLWTLLVILIVLWALGLAANVGGGLIHLLLVLAAVIVVVNLLTGRRTPV